MIKIIIKYSFILRNKGILETKYLKCTMHVKKKKRSRMVNAKTLLDVKEKERILYSAVKEIKITWNRGSIRLSQIYPTTFNDIQLNKI